MGGGRGGVRVVGGTLRGEAVFRNRLPSCDTRAVNAVLRSESPSGCSFGGAREGGK